MNLKKEKLVVTVETEPGSHGREVAEKLSGMLGIPCYDREIPKEAAEISRIPLKLILRYEEKNAQHAYDLTAEDESGIRIPPAKYFLMAQIAACRAIADRGSCILLDHHSNTALGDREGHVRVFVHAERRDKEIVYAIENNMDFSQAKKVLPKAERKRRRYFRGVNRNWGRTGNYDLTVNSSHGTPEAIAEHIVEYLQKMTEEDLIHPTQARKRSA